MGESAVSYQDFLVPIIVCLIVYIIGVKMGTPREKRKRDDAQMRLWWMHYNIINPHQLADLIQRKSITYLEAHEYLRSLDIDSETAGYMLDTAIQRLAEHHDNNKKG